MTKEALLPSLTQQAFEGCIIRTAVGDSLGLPYEGLSPARANRMFPRKDSYHLFLRFGMMSDDTEHTLLAA